MKNVLMFLSQGVEDLEAVTIIDVLGWTNVRDNLSPVYFSSIPPLSEKNQKAKLVLQLKGKKKPGTIAMNANVIQRLTNIRKEFNGTSYDFVKDLKKVQQQEED